MVRLIRQIRSLAMSIGMVLALPWSALCQADEIFPVVHNDTITVRVLNGKYGVPITHAHLTLAGGYDARDIGLGLWQEELLTDKTGEVRLPNGLANLPFLRVLVTDHKLCQAHPKAGMFSVDRMRRDGLSAPNRCGTFAVEDAPGVFTVFVNGDNGTSPVIRGGGAAAVSTPAARAVVPAPAPVERQTSAAPTLPFSDPILAVSSVDPSASTNPPNPGSKADLKAGSGPSDSVSPGSAVSSSTVSRSGVSGSAAPGSAYQTDLTQPPFAGMDKSYFTTPSTAPTLLLAPIPLVASSGHRAPTAMTVRFPVSPATCSLTNTEAETPDSAHGSGVASPKRHKKTANKDSSTVPSPIPPTNPSRVRKAAAAPNSDPEEGSPRRHPRKARTNPAAVPSAISRKAETAPASVPVSAGASPSQPATKASPSPSTTPPPIDKAGAAPVPAPNKNPTAAPGKQPQAGSDLQPKAALARSPRLASAKPRAGTLANSDSDSAAPRRKPQAPAANSEQPASAACQAIPGK